MTNQASSPHVGLPILIPRLVAAFAHPKHGQQSALLIPQVEDYWPRWPAHLDLVKAIATGDKAALSSALDKAGDVT